MSPSRAPANDDNSGGGGGTRPRSAVAYVVRYRGDTGVGETVRGAGEVRWLLHWPDASFWPDASASGRAVGEAALSVMRSWNVTRVLTDGTLPAPGLSGTPE